MGLECSEWWASRPGHINPRERPLSINWIRGWKNRKAGLDVVENRNILYSKPQSSSPQPCWIRNFGSHICLGVHVYLRTYVLCIFVCVLACKHLLFMNILMDGWMDEWITYVHNCAIVCHIVMAKYEKQRNLKALFFSVSIDVDVGSTYISPASPENRERLEIWNCSDVSPRVGIEPSLKL